MNRIKFKFESYRSEFIELVKNCIATVNINLLEEKAQQKYIIGCESDFKTTIDQAFRDVLSEAILNGAKRDELEKMLMFAIEATERDICSGSLPVLLLSDMFDCFTLDQCEELFTFVENRVNIWKKDIFFKNCKNQLLRSCNDLLRRLSRSQNTVFCGRILVFLARLFPLSERSGLNIISEFNLDNITSFSRKEDNSIDEISGDKDENMEEGEMDDSGCPINVDYNLYRKFWSLQEYFRQPNLCYNKIYWRQFASYSADVLSAFGSFKLDDIKSTKWKLSEATASSTGKPVYFAKYLTSQKLLELELSDSNFRRYALVQFLILFQYLQSAVKFKQVPVSEKENVFATISRRMNTKYKEMNQKQGECLRDSYVLTEEQLAWIKDTTERIYKLLEETPPDGASFAKHVSHILKREEYWNNWKNEGCPNFKEVKQDTEMRPFLRQKRKLGNEIQAAIAKKEVLVGSSEMNRLWNLCPDNWEACRSQARSFVPSLDTFFESAIEQADPSSQIENSFKYVHNSNYGWRALRLLSQKSPHFFTHSNQPIKSLPLYLESMIMKLAKELPLNQHHQQSQEEKQDVASVAGDSGEDSEDELLKNSDEGGNKEDKDRSKHVNPLTLENVLQMLSVKLQRDWKTVAPKLGFQPDEILYFENELQSPTQQAKHMLTVWVEQEPETATVSNLQKILNDVALEDIAKELNNVDSLNKVQIKT
ncbi:THO complex subunit 1-like isoform X1 [Centruroides sculpturatus]|uniref:THO complex subunit 1-like isoform X1 n=1 Tax=Centruroides sculpturatus TaxID=218467 RepID=UPI000C6D17C8|nr:THO complex subunit 1-like isoform X1 [Centruroides sculpturatus]